MVLCKDLQATGRNGRKFLDRDNWNSNHKQRCSHTHRWCFLYSSLRFPRRLLGGGGLCCWQHEDSISNCSKNDNSLHFKFAPQPRLDKNSAVGPYYEPAVTTYRTLVQSNLFWNPLPAFRWSAYTVYLRSRVQSITREYKSILMLLAEQKLCIDDKVHYILLHRKVNRQGYGFGFLFYS